MVALTSICHFWGKAQPAEIGGPTFHPLLAHCIDVAACAEALNQARPLDLPVPLLMVLAALHDIGKVSPVFQFKVPQLWPAGLGALPTEMLGDPGHDSVGFHLLCNPDIHPCIAALLDEGDNGGATAAILRAVCGHHGRPPLSNAPHHRVLAPARGPADALVDCLAAVFQPQSHPLPPDITHLTWRLAGLVNLADWIGSWQHHFRYVTPEALRDPGAYLETARRQARAAVAAAGLAPARASAWTGWSALLGDRPPSPVQDWAASVAIPDGPSLFVIEDLTGSGKTEAALALTHRLLEAGRGEGVFVALPTMATANAMFERLSKHYRSLFDDAADPSLALAHGRAKLHRGFSEAILSGAAEDAGPGGGGDVAEPAGAQCAAWLAGEGRRAVLAQVGVGTIDQALLAILPVRYAALRLHAIARKVLVIDEVHSFDPYMEREIIALLEFHAALGGSAILLSATLTQAARAKLCRAFRTGLGLRGSVSLAQTAYPLTTTVSAAGVAETPCAIRAGLAREVAVTRLDDADAAVERIVAANVAGAAVAWVRNTVDEVIAAAALLRARGVDPIVFHARFAMGDRLAIEEDVKRRFGPGAGDRHAVLVASQVIEQSLDLDFDLLVTDLAPADLLIQRAGRLWRHRRDPRPVPGPELLVVSPDPVSDPPVDWISATQSGTLAVYRDPALLWRGARAVFAAGRIASPRDFRPFVEAAAAWDEVPDAFSAVTGKAQGKRYCDAGAAGLSVLKFDPPYIRDNGLWDPDTHTPTRLEEQEQIILRLAVVYDDRIVPYADGAGDIARAWALNEVSVAKNKVSDCKVPQGLAKAAEAARATWGRWERDSPRIKLAVLRPSGEGWKVDVELGSTPAGTAWYSKRDGFGLQAPQKRG